MTNLKPEEISSIIKEQIEKYKDKLETSEEGVVIQIADGIARIHGLKDAIQGELLIFPGEVYGMIQNLEEDNIGCVLLGDAKDIKEGDSVKRTKKVMSVPVGAPGNNELLVGRNHLDDDLGVVCGDDSRIFPVSPLVKPHTYRGKLIANRLADI